VDWQKLLNPDRLGTDTVPAKPQTRTVFQRDFDRIVFSSAFRRLQDKTQVFPLAESDYVRTRLTHSLETASVGRSLGTSVGQHLVENDEALARIYHPSQLGDIVAAACLAHDIGNPPFGHAGEDAIAYWFGYESAGRELIARLDKENAASADFVNFEGNAQGFRILTRLEHPQNAGGMQLTYAALAASTKYPWPSAAASAGAEGVTDANKHGFFAADRELFQEVAEAVGLHARNTEYSVYARHPLAFLVEAADDICYHVVDIEDGYRLNHITYEEAWDLLYNTILDPEELAEDQRFRTEGNIRGSHIQYLRSKAIGSLIQQTVDTFNRYHDELLNGTFDEPLMSRIPCSEDFYRLKQVAAEKVYCEQGVALINAAGFNVLGQLIDMFVTALDQMASTKPVSRKWKNLWQLFPQEFLRTNNTDELQQQSLYQRVLAVTDFVSSLTDRNAVSLFRQLTGISLSGE